MKGDFRAKFTKSSNLLLLQYYLEDEFLSKSISTAQMSLIISNHSLTELQELDLQVMRN